MHRSRPEQPVYLDHAATTPLAPSVLRAMVDALGATWGNPANSSHEAGRAAIRSIEDARTEVAALIGADPERVYFTSGATEANNLAIRGVVERASAMGIERPLVLVSAIEHRSVLAPVDSLVERDRIESVQIPVTADGVVDLDAYDALLERRPLLVCVHLANNEIGTIQPIAELVRRAHARGALVLCDATQAVGKLEIDVAELGDVDLLALSAHKFHGPKGAGALYVANDIEVEPQVIGGGQEHGLRAGTPNVPAIVGMGAAARHARESLEAGDPERVTELREQLERALLRLAGCAKVNGAGAPRLPGISSITFPGSCGGALVAELRELQLSRGSACSTGSAKPSHVLTALGHPAEDAFATLRLSLGSTTTGADVRRTIDAFARALDAQEATG